MVVNNNHVYVGFSSDYETQIFKYNKEGYLEEQQGFSFSSIAACSDSINLNILSGAREHREKSGYITITDF